jgi:hypothetical protein
VNSLGANNYFNVSAFSDPGDQVAGDGPRFNNALRGDGIRNLDFSLFKNLNYRERYHLQLRAEFFNSTNTPRFKDPDTRIRRYQLWRHYGPSEQSAAGADGCAVHVLVRLASRRSGSDWF